LQYYNRNVFFGRAAKCVTLCLSVIKAHILGDFGVKQAKLLSDTERKRLAAVVDSRRHSVRNHTAVALSFYAGLRACEIAALRIGDVFDEAGAVRDTIYLSAAQTKGNTGSTVLVNKRLSAALKRYATAYPKRLQQPNSPIMFSAKGAGFTAQTVVNLFQNLYRAAAVPGASSHSGRRQFVTELADKGVNARVVQALARHRHLNTTMRYIDLNENKMRAAVELVNY
jgi:integrase/recombinase XerD